LNHFYFIFVSSGSQLYLETLLSRHARLLLQNYRIRALGEFSRKLGFPLAQWLPRESHRAAVVSDVAGAFEALHQQFNWPYPANVQVLDEIFKRVSSKPATTYQVSPQKSREEEMWLVSLSNFTSPPSQRHSKFFAPYLSLYSLGPFYS
jgi:hypothetical protein